MAKATDPYSKQTPLLRLSNRDVLTIGDSYQGIQIFGATGSGKTSGSGASLARAMLRLGYGGVVFTVKSDEPDLWAHELTGYIAQTGRQSELINFSVESGLRFDFLQYEFGRPGPGAGDTNDLADLFTTVLENAGREKGPQEQYWENALRQLLVNTIDLAKFSVGKVSLSLLAQIVARAPIEPNGIFATADTFRDPIWGGMVQDARKNAVTPRQRDDLELTLRYFHEEYPRLAPKTRSSIVSIFTSMADRLLRGTAGEIFSNGEVTVRPEESFDGKIILVNLPTEQFGATGRFAQLIFKYMWQKAAKRRARSASMRPVFLWCDESQELVTKKDAEFQATARSSCVATVYLTQNLSTYHARIEKDHTASLLGNLNTKIFHANGEVETNKWASDLFGEQWGTTTDVTYGNVENTDKSSLAPSQWKKTSESTKPELMSTVKPSDFTALKTGGSRFGGRTSAYVFAAGRVWNLSGTNCLYVEFTQSGNGAESDGLAKPRWWNKSYRIGRYWYTARQLATGSAIGLSLLSVTMYVAVNAPPTPQVALGPTRKPQPRVDNPLNEVKENPQVVTQANNNPVWSWNVFSNDTPASDPHENEIVSATELSHVRNEVKDAEDRIEKLGERLGANKMRNKIIESVQHQVMVMNSPEVSKTWTAVNAYHVDDYTRDITRATFLTLTTADQKIISGDLTKKEKAEIDDAYNKLTKIEEDAKKQRDLQLRFADLVRDNKSIDLAPYCSDITVGMTSAEVRELWGNHIEQPDDSPPLNDPRSLLPRRPKPPPP